MKMPAVYDDDDMFKAYGDTYPDGSPIRTRVYSIVFPPVGFFPFVDTGTGDYYGFYWPIGREDSPPIVAFSSHDAYALIPQHGDLPAAGRCQLARSEERELTFGFENAFSALGLPLPTVDFAGVVAVDDHRQLLSFDSESPFRHCAVGGQDITDGNLESAELGYRKAIELLPEYGAAHFGLGYLLRRLRREGEASIHLRMSLTCPLAFTGSSFWADHFLPGGFRQDWARKALMWLQQIKEPHESLRDDPFMENVALLKMDTGVAESRDMELLTAMVGEYLDRGQFLAAIYLWITVGDRAAQETTSFRERYCLTAASFGTRLSELFRAAGLERRASLVDHMLAIMDKPDGLYL